MADFALPQSFSISDVKRNSIPAVRRTVIHGSTSQNTYGPGELIDIPVDTGTSGSFFDPQTSRIDMTVNIYNPNYFVDFINLPRCGFHALFEQFSVIIHNTEHEMQRYYTEMIELEMIRHGENSKPFELTVPNPYKLAGGLAGDLHINLIKPSMVTTAGLPHGVKYAELQSPFGSSVATSVSNTITEGLLLNSQPYLKKPFGRTHWDNLVSHDSNPVPGTIRTTMNPASATDDHFGYWAETGLYSSSQVDDTILAQAKRNFFVPTGRDPIIADGVANAALPDPASYRWYAPPVAGSRQTLTAGTPDAYHTRVNFTDRFVGYQAHGGNYSKVYPFVETFGNRRGDNTMFDVNYGQTVGGYTPMMWPAKQPTDLHALQKIRKEQLLGVNTKNIQNYYAHCKNIPIGIPIDLRTDITGKSTIWGGDDVLKLPEKSDRNRGQLYSFRISLKIYSCLFGVFAKKMFPSLLIGAGRVRFRIRLQQPNVAFQTLMDPCRVVPGTARDKFPYLGIFRNTAIPGGALTTLGNLTKGSIQCIAHGIHPILLSDYVPGECYNDLVCTGRFPIPQMRMKMANEIRQIFATATRMAMTNHQNTLLQNGWLTRAATIGATTEFPDALEPGHRSMFELVRLVQPNEQVLGGNNANPHDPAYQYRAAVMAVEPAIGADAAAAHTRINRLTARISHEIGGVYKVLSDILYEFANNAEFGYVPQPIETTGAVAQEVVDASDGGLRTNPQLRRKEQLTSASAVFEFQNYHSTTDYTTLFSNYQNTANGNFTTTQGGQGMTQMIFPSEQIGATILPSDFRAKSMNWDPFQVPVPQYVPMAKPWDKRPLRSITAADFLPESELCYGTYLERSVAQVRRTNKNLFPLMTDPAYYPTLGDRLTYTVSNIAYRVEEIILPEAASLQIISAAMEGGITIEATTIKCSEQILQKQDNQKVLLNVSAGIVDDIAFTFQPTEIYTGDRSYGYNSYATYCPYTSFTFKPQTTGTRVGNVDVQDAPQSPENYNYLGGDPSYYNSLNFGENIGIQTYLTIGTEFFPRVPINDLQTLVDHVTWGDQRRGDYEYLNLEPVLHNTFNVSNFQSVLPFQDGFFSVFTPIECLDDQTITDNPYWTPLEMNIGGVIRGRRAKNPALPIFKPYDGTFHLSFNLQAFMYQQDRMNVGIPMVNNNSYLQMQGCHLLREFETRMITHIRCFARIVIERGGIVQIFT